MLDELKVVKVLQSLDVLHVFSLGIPGLTQYPLTTRWGARDNKYTDDTQSDPEGTQYILNLGLEVIH